MAYDEIGRWQHLIPEAGHEAPCWGNYLGNDELFPDDAGPDADWNVPGRPWISVENVSEADILPGFWQRDGIEGNIDFDMSSNSDEVEDEFDIDAEPDEDLDDLEAPETIFAYDDVEEPPVRNVLRFGGHDDLPRTRPHARTGRFLRNDARRYRMG